MKFATTLLLIASVIATSHASKSLKSSQLKHDECPGFLGNCADEECCEGLKCVDDTCVPDECSEFFQSCSDNECCPGLQCADDICVPDDCSELFQSCSDTKCCKGLQCVDDMCVVENEL